MYNIDIKIIIRQLIRKKTYTLFNILGLGIGLGCVMLMATYLIHEFSFDQYHTKATDIYRVVDGNDCKTVYAMGEAFKKDIPEIENIFRIYDVELVQIYQNDETIEERNFIMADPSILEMLDIDLLSGKKEELLAHKSSLILSERVAQKYFPNENPVGKSLKIKLNLDDVLFNITGVYNNFPSHSSLQTDFIGNIENAFESLIDIGYSVGVRTAKKNRDFLNTWDNNEFMSFVQLRQNTNAVEVEQKCSEICIQHHKENTGGGIRLQSYTDMYLHSNEYNNTEPFMVNQLQSLKIFMGIGLLILLVSCVNFILISNSNNNLSMTEIACRKVNGASRRQIAYLSLLKSCLVAFLSLIPALVFVWLLLPVFNNLFQNELDISLLSKLPYIASILLITMLTGISAGIYLGVYASGVSPVKLFRTGVSSIGGKEKFKGSVVIIQFVAFILLSVCFMLMQKQYNFSLKKDLGLNTRNVLVVEFGNGEFQNSAHFIKNELLRDPNVLSCVPTSFMTPPSDNVLIVSYKDKDANKPKEQEALFFGVGELELLEIPIVDGVTFSSENAKDRNNIVINEAAAKKYSVGAGDNISHFKVIGVVPNFHYHSLHSAVSPIFIIGQTSNYPNLLVKTNGDFRPVVKHLKEICGDIAPGFTFEYELLDDRVTMFYKKEEKQVGTIAFFSAIAITLSIMGLLGFVLITLSKRTKEIGIRKVNGAKVSEIIQMLNKDFIKWVLVAFIIACPIAWYAMTKWLENFAYKTELSWWIFALAGFIALFIALVTVSWQSWRAASKNPVEALRYE